MGQCSQCGRVAREISEQLGLCLDCIRQADSDTLARLDALHRRNRHRFALPEVPPNVPTGLPCQLCHNNCRIAPGGRGYCGVRRHTGKTLTGGTASAAPVQWYHDPLPTNCVASWVCPAGTNAGYPHWSYMPAPEYGYFNLAVFYNACTFDCLFCQNWRYRLHTTRPQHSAAELARSVTPETACICFFGGDPAAAIGHALAAANLALERAGDRPLRICWETNGSMHPQMLDRMIELSLHTGGCLKFDLKAMDNKLHRALCGTDNRRTLDNFARAAHRITERPEPSPLVASTLLVPGYVDRGQVAAIAEFIAELNPEIPYALLAFRGQFLMSEMPTTSRQHAEACMAAAIEAGLKRVRLGNVHLLRQQ